MYALQPRTKASKADPLDSKGFYNKYICRRTTKRLPNSKYIVVVFLYATGFFVTK